MKSVVDKAISSCDSLLEDSGAVLSTNKINPNLTVLAASAELASVIANMIQNAIQVCDSTPDIEVWAGAVNQHMMLIQSF